MFRASVSLRRWSQAIAVSVLAIIMLGANDSSSRFNRVGHKMICVCSCTQILLECNHVGCPDSDRMIGELRQQVAGGGSDTPIMNWFAAKYGPTVLAAPMRGGFDNVAWIAPFVVFVLATFGTAFTVKMWRGRSSPRAVSVGEDWGMGISDGEGIDAVRERIRRETEY